MTANRKSFSQCARRSEEVLHSFACRRRWEVRFFDSRRAAWRGLLVVLLLPVAAPPRAAKGFHRGVAFSLSSQTVEAYDFVEVVLNVSSADARNSFKEVSVKGQFGKSGEDKRLAVDGFCDSPDGSVFRMRFMPSSPGDYGYPSLTGKGRIRKTTQAPSGRLTATVAVRCAWTRSIHGASYGRVRYYCTNL
jgi:hypothetical protein